MFYSSLGPWLVRWCAGCAAGADPQWRPPRSAEPHPGGAVQAHQRQALRCQRAYQCGRRHDHEVRLLFRLVKLIYGLLPRSMGYYSAQWATRSAPTHCCMPGVPQPGSLHNAATAFDNALDYCWGGARVAHHLLFFEIECYGVLAAAGSRRRTWRWRLRSRPATTTAVCHRRWRPSGRWAWPASCGACGSVAASDPRCNNHILHHAVVCYHKVRSMRRLPSRMVHRSKGRRMSLCAAAGRWGIWSAASLRPPSWASHRWATLVIVFPPPESRPLHWEAARKRHGPQVGGAPGHRAIPCQGAVHEGVPEDGSSPAGRQAHALPHCGRGAACAGVSIYCSPQCCSTCSLCGCSMGGDGKSESALKPQAIQVALGGNLQKPRAKRASSSSRDDDDDDSEGE